MIEILNFQPFGDHGVMSLWSIRVVHIMFIVPIYYMIKHSIRERKLNRNS